MRWLDGITDLMDMSLSELQELVMNREAWSAEIHVFAKSWTQGPGWRQDGLLISFSFRLSRNETNNIK